MRSYNDLDATIFLFRYVFIITKYVAYSGQVAREQLFSEYDSKFKHVNLGK